MLIKQVTKKGDAIPLSPQEALKPALQRALAAQSTAQKVLWLDGAVLIADSVQVTQGDGDLYEAVATGTCMVGHTITETDQFHNARPHSFRVHYRSAKDDIGVPDIDIVSAVFSRTPQNFSKGPEAAAPPKEESSQGGKITSKYSKKL